MLIGLGWINRERVIPALRRSPARAARRVATGVLARRTMRGELALMLCVFGVTAALVTYAPPIDAAIGSVLGDHHARPGRARDDASNRPASA